MSVRTELQKTVGDSRRMMADTRKVILDTRRVVGEAKPLYAVAGAGDRWVAMLRDTGARLQSTRVEPTDLQKRVTESVDGLQSGVVSVQHAVQAQLATLPGAAVDAVNRLVETYDDLARCGERTVGRIRRQQATQDLAAQARTATSKAKATATTARKRTADTAADTKNTAAKARKNASATTTQAKAATTSARKAAAASRKAAADAADKIG